MTLNLSAYGEIQTALFCRIDVPNYEILRFSNFSRPLTIDGESYTGIGNLMGVSSTASELRVSTGELTVTISGIPTKNISDVLNYKFKGSDIKIYRGVFNPTNGQLLAITGNPTGKFQGIVNNFALEETWSGQDSMNTIAFTCTSTIGVLTNKTTGRRTNPIDEKTFYPTDLSMDRVPSLANSNFDFGSR
jgi:hypothetical protein